MFLFSYIKHCPEWWNRLCELMFSIWKTVVIFILNCSSWVSYMLLLEHTDHPSPFLKDNLIVTHLFLRWSCLPSRTWSKVSGSRTCRRCWPRWAAARAGWSRTWWVGHSDWCRPNTVRSCWRMSGSCTSRASPKPPAGWRRGVLRVSRLPTPPRSAPLPQPPLRAQTTSMASPNLSLHL